MRDLRRQLARALRPEPLSAATLAELDRSLAEAQRWVDETEPTEPEAVAGFLAELETMLAEAEAMVPPWRRR